MGMTAPHLLMGRLGERVACRFLMTEGFDVLARRFKARRGEIDLIAFEGNVLVCVEVKTRASRAFGEPWEFVDWENSKACGRRSRSSWRATISASTPTASTSSR